MKRKIEATKNIIEENTDESEDDELEQTDEEGSESEDSNGDAGSDEDENNLDASATESDSDDHSEELVEEKSEEPKTRAEIIKKGVLERYEERQGKQLYICFRHNIQNTDDDLEQMAKELSPLITKVHKPRQKSARFCLVDFNTRDDRDAALRALRNSIQKGELTNCIVNIPRTESIEYVNELAERKIKSVENKKAKARLKKASKKSLGEKVFTSTVVVLNLPKTASLIQVREIFPNAVDIQIKAGKGKLNKNKSIAAVTLPSTAEARKAVKQKLSLGGNQLMVKFDNQVLKKKKGKLPQQEKRLSNKQVSEKTEDVDELEATSTKKRKIESNDVPPAGDTGNKTKTKKTKFNNKKNKFNKKSQKVPT